MNLKMMTTTLMYVKHHHGPARARVGYPVRVLLRCLDCSGHLPGTAPYVAISSVLKTLVGTTDLVPFPMLPPIGPGLPDQ